MTKQDVSSSQGILYYGRTLVEEVLRGILVAANDSELHAWVEKNGQSHTTRRVTKDEFLVRVHKMFNYISHYRY